MENVSIAISRAVADLRSANSQKGERRGRAGADLPPCLALISRILFLIVSNLVILL